ncbi:hypothetical protein GGD83_004464 [Rhodoblastus sphagnicola]|uniref:hypothetical protein n=1 Tax=Rhodoblastus sphagnicola TaxID=333368 RepID=UPI0017B150CE|nr:hypothetical protein [Rhodoblastus sphagnicola]
MPGVVPDYPAPIVRVADGERELTMARWGMPSPQVAPKGKTSDPRVTNIRNVTSPHWRRWLGPDNRCLVPFVHRIWLRAPAGETMTPQRPLADGMRAIVAKGDRQDVFNPK